MIFALVTLGLLGLAVGSFINTAAIRFVRGESIRGRSRCPSCAAPLQWFELVPIVSFLWQRGSCRSCAAPVSVRYPLGELATGLLFVAVSWRLFLFPEFRITPVDATAELILWLIYTAILLVFFQTDLDSELLPDRLMYPAIALALAGSILEASWGAPPRQGFGGQDGFHWLGPYGMLGGWLSTTWLGRLVAALSAALFFFAISFFSRGRWMGWGDGKLVFLLGMMFGFPDIVVVLSTGFILGGVFSVYLLLAKRATRKSIVPFGPFLIAGAFVTMLSGREIIRWYFSFFSL